MSAFWICVQAGFVIPILWCLLGLIYCLWWLALAVHRVLLNGSKAAVWAMRRLCDVMEATTHVINHMFARSA